LPPLWLFTGTHFPVDEGIGHWRMSAYCQKSDFRVGIFPTRAATGLMIALAMGKDEPVRDSQSLPTHGLPRVGAARYAGTGRH
jgi:hypothetical protein